jgi:hypothetical protein
MPRMHSVASSYIAAIGYDPAARELHVRLVKADETHVYLGVEQAVYDRLLLSDSKGAYVNDVLRRGYQHVVL